MPDFSTGAELELTVSDSSLKDAKNTIESELGNLEVDVNAIVGGGGGGRQPRDPKSGRFMAMEGVEQRVVNSNEHLEDIRNILLDMDDKIGGGGMMAAGGGGGDGGTTILGATGLGGLLGGSGGTAGGGVLAGLLVGTGGLIGGSILGGVGALALMDRNLSDERKREMGRQNQQVREQARRGNLDVMMNPFGNQPGGGGTDFSWPWEGTTFKWPWEDGAGNVPNRNQGFRGARGLTQDSVGERRNFDRGGRRGRPTEVSVEVNQSIDSGDVARKAGREAQRAAREEMERIERELEDMKDQISRGLQ